MHLVGVGIGGYQSRFGTEWLLSMTRYVKPREVADYFGVCLHTLRRWEQKGWINAIL